MASSLMHGIRSWLIRFFYYISGEETFRTEEIYLLELKQPKR